MIIGDMVMLVWACCADGRAHLGWVGTIEGIKPQCVSWCHCGIETDCASALITIDGAGGAVPLSWLIKIEPPAKTEHETTQEEITA